MISDHPSKIWPELDWSEIPAEDEEFHGWVGRQPDPDAHVQVNASVIPESREGDDGWRMTGTLYWNGEVEISGPISQAEIAADSIEEGVDRLCEELRDDIVDRVRTCMAGLSVLAEEIHPGDGSDLYGDTFFGAIQRVAETLSDRYDEDPSRHEDKEMAELLFGALRGRRASLNRTGVDVVTMFGDEHFDDWWEDRRSGEG